MNFGTNWASWMGEMTQHEVEKTLDYYYSKGGNFVDTANAYQGGQSESWIGEWMKKKGNRDEMVIATKYTAPIKDGAINLAGNHRKNMFHAIEESLKRLQTHYIDLYYLHFWDHTTPVVEILRAFDDLVRSGKVHYIGISDTSAWQVSRANAIAELQGWTQFVAYQGKYNLGIRDMERDIIPMSREMGLGVVPWGVLGQGKYTGKYKKGSQGAEDAKRGGLDFTEQDWLISDEVLKIAEEVKKTPSQVVLNWTLQQPGITSPLIGCRTANQLVDNIDALNFKLGAEHVARLSEVSKFSLGFPYDFLGGQDYSSIKYIKSAGDIVQ
eukprot:TRINITY_DN9621_c0_g1_i1.p1 TRINITY_DN9621_c0_g1~~TRINITY_DN9621_c0_g1_i1.p1  ORF type:complete len:325 (+),score=59.39 TRINITY_DN9621_c0_g1_i1:84-1058(+)